MGGNISKKRDTNGYNEKLFQKISHTDILEYIKENMSKIDIEIDVNDDYIIFNDKDNQGLARILMYPIEQFIEHMTGGEEIDFIKLNQLILKIGKSHEKLH